jgi:hypothetical protein
VKSRTFVEGDAALKNFTEAMSVLFRAPKPEIRKPVARKKNSKRRH